MCDAHQKSPLALGKGSFNPSMPLRKAQPKGRLILSTGIHQMLPCPLHPSLRLCPTVASQESPLTCNDRILRVHAGTYSRGVTPCFTEVIIVNYSVWEDWGINCSCPDWIQIFMGQRYQSSPMGGDVVSLSPGRVSEFKCGLCRLM